MDIRRLASIVLIALLCAPAFSIGESESASFADQAYKEGREIKTTVTITPGTPMNLNTDLAMAADLLKSLKIETSEQQQGEDVLSRFSFFLQDKPALSAAFLAKDDKLHVMSSLLGNQTLSFTQEEFAALYSKMLKDVPEDMLNTDLNSINRLFLYVTHPNDNPKDKVSYIESLGFDPVNFQTDLMDPLTGWVSYVMSDPKVTAGVFESEKHDTAVTKKEYAVSNEQLRLALHMIAAWAVQDKNLAVLNKMASSRAGTASIDKEESLKTLLTMPNEFAKAAGVFLQKPVLITEFLDAEGVRKATEIRVDIFNPTSTITVGEYIKTEADGISTMYGLEMASNDINNSISILNKDTASFKQGDDTVTPSHWQAVLNTKQTGSYATRFALTFDGESSVNGKNTREDWKLHFEVNTSGTVS